MLVNTRCLLFTKMMASIVLHEKKIKQDMPEEHINQYKYHIASCSQCFYRAQHFVEKKRDFCPHLFKILKYAYSTGEMPHEIWIQYQKIFKNKFSAEEKKEVEKHIENCTQVCQYWLKVIKHGWKLTLTITHQAVQEYESSWESIENIVNEKGWDALKTNDFQYIFSQVTNYLRYKISDVNTIEDIAQNCLIALFRINPPNKITHLKNYIFRLVQYKLIDQYRIQNKFYKTVSLEQKEIVERIKDKELSDALEQQRIKERLEIVQEAMSLLSLEEQTLFEYLKSGYDYKQISKMMGIPHYKLRFYFNRLRKKLWESLKDMKT